MPTGDPQWPLYDGNVPGFYGIVTVPVTAFVNNWTSNSSQNRGLEAPELGERWLFTDGVEATVMSVIHTVSPHGRTIVCTLRHDDGTPVNMTPEQVWLGTYIPQIPDRYEHLIRTTTQTIHPGIPTSQSEPVTRLTSFERLLLDNEDD